MNKQILLCMECNSKSRTDFLYIESAIKRFYINDRKIVYRPIFMGTKTKYDDKGVVNDINTRIRKFPGKTAVIYFIDTDNYDLSYEDNLLFEKIKAYCGAMGFDFVFFCKDIEDFFWGEAVSDDEKLKKAEAFNRKGLINRVNDSSLCQCSKRKHCSNILNILDKYWVRK